jgi:methionyl-tRNA synthetase
LAGIGKSYEPESLVGRELLFVANLEPRMIMGFESQGMILAASDESGPVVLSPDRELPPGSALK